MKLLITALAVLCITQVSVGQAGGSVMSGGNILVANAGRPPTYLRDVFPNQTKPIHRSDINGSPFVFDNWLLATIVLADERVFDSIYVKLNAYNDKVHFKNDNDEEMQTSIRVKQVTITDNNSVWHGVIFRTGYEGDPVNFFRVIEDGKRMQLLKKIEVSVWETKALGEEDKKTFQQDETPFIAINNVLYKQNKSCNPMAEAYEKYKEKMQQFVSDNNIRCNREEDMRKLVAYFNTL
jgi:hypothetical protein